MKRGNIFGINPNETKALEEIVNEIIRVLENPDTDPSQIEIEIKYAEFRYFSPPRYNQLMSRIQDGKQKQIAFPFVNMVEQQRFYFKDSLKKLSRQNMILLNSLGRGIYALTACFDQERYKNFYQMKEYLIKQSEFNEHFKKNNILLPQGYKNIYHQYSKIGDNMEFQLQTKGQIRFDVYFKDLSSPLNGRYSYSNLTKKWVKTKKTQLIKEQIDLMLSEKTFRFALSKQEQTEVSYQDLQALRQEFIKRRFKQFQIRLKRTLRCTKSGIVEYSLSEVYEPGNSQYGNQNFEDLDQYITGDSDQLDMYIMKKFQHFYDYRSLEEIQDPTKCEIKHEVQCEFTQLGVKQFKDWISKKQYREIHYEVDETIQSLYNLFYADHSVRTHEAPWMDGILQSKKKFSAKNSYPGQRLVNQFGSYMHSILHQEMTKIKNIQSIFQ